MSDTAITKNHNPLAIDPYVLTKLTTYEDYLSYYIQLTETADTVSWIKADLLLHMSGQLGEKSLEALAAEIKQPKSTVSNYIRTARAFPAETRNPAMSFSHHFQASYADIYNEKTHTFTGDKRFEWVNKAIDEGFSTRRLAEEIHIDKKHEAMGGEFQCVKCGKKTDVIKHWVLYSPGTRREAVRFDLHDDCYLKIMDFINEKKP